MWPLWTTFNTENHFVSEQNKKPTLQAEACIGVRAGGRGGLQPPQSLGNSDFLGSKRKFGQSQFLKTFPRFIIIIIILKR